MLKIGFSNKYFTLWDVTSEDNYSTDPNGNHYLSSVNTQFTYFQNLSMDEGKAIEKAKSKGVTDLLPDTELRGKHSSWSRSTKIPYDYNEFQFTFGRYDMMDIRECTDFDYLIWYYENRDTNKYVSDKITELNSNYLPYEDRIETKENIERFKKQDKIRKSRELELETNGFVDLFVEYNVGYDGTINVDGINFQFERVSENYYNGYSYYLPKINGKGKRIKNKTVRFFAIKRNIDGWDMWVVSNIEIVKTLTKL